MPKRTISSIRSTKPASTVCRFVPRWGRRYLLRNHQKLALADEARVIIGGFNIQDSYFGTVASQAWRDLGLYVEGPSAAHLAGYFDALDGWAKQDNPPLRSLRALAVEVERARRPDALAVRRAVRAGRRPGRARCAPI